MYISVLYIYIVNFNSIFVYKKLICFYEIIDIFIVLSVKNLKVDNCFNASILDLIKQKIKNAVHNIHF